MKEVSFIRAFSGNVGKNLDIPTPRRTPSAVKEGKSPGSFSAWIMVGLSIWSSDLLFPQLSSYKRGIGVGRSLRSYGADSTSYTLPVVQRVHIQNTIFQLSLVPHQIRFNTDVQNPNPA